MTVTDETLREALARCIVERDNATGEAIRLQKKLDASNARIENILSILDARERRALAPYPTMCCQVNKCAGFSNCQHDPNCID